MKRTLAKLISLLTVVCMLGSVALQIPVSAFDGPGESVTPGGSSPAFGSIEEIVASYHNPKGRPMSCIHRALPYVGCPYPENSIPAIEACIAAGADMVELDISKTSDDKFVLSHDGSMQRCTSYSQSNSGSKAISSLTYAQTQKYYLYEYYGNQTNSSASKLITPYVNANKTIYVDENGKKYTMPTFEEALAVCRGHIMVNVDKFDSFWGDRMALYELVKDAGCLDIVVFKASSGTVTPDDLAGWFSEIKAQYGQNAQLPLFSAVTGSGGTGNDSKFVYQTAMPYIEAGATCLECGSSFNHASAQPDVQEIIGEKVRLFANALTYCNHQSSAGGAFEDTRLYCEMIAHGLNVIQCNSAVEIGEYIRTVYSDTARPVTEKINPKLFSDFTYDKTAATVNTTVQITTNGVSIANNDTLTYQNIDFGSDGITKFAVGIGNNPSGGVLSVRLDSMDNEPIAVYKFSADDGVCGETVWASLVSKVRGTHTVYLTATDTNYDKTTDQKLTNTSTKSNILITCFFGTSGNTGSSYPDTLPQHFFMKRGTDPNLPETVSVRCDNGTEKQIHVMWLPYENWDNSCKTLTEYNLASTTTLKTFKVPGLVVETGETIYAEVYLIPTPVYDAISKAVVWYDANFGVIGDENGRITQWVDRINGIPAVADTFVAEPTYDKTTSPYSVRFDGVYNGLTFASPIDLNGRSELSLMIRAKNTNATSAYDNYEANSTTAYSINQAARYTLLQFGESGGWGCVWLTAFKNAVICRLGTGVSNTRGFMKTGLSLSDFTLTTVTKSGTSEKLYSADSLIYTAAANDGTYTGAPGSVIKNTNSYAYLGYGYQGSGQNYYYNGSASDVLVFDEALTATEIANLNTYLNNKASHAYIDCSSKLTTPYSEFVSSLDADDAKGYIISAQLELGSTLSMNYVACVSNGTPYMTFTRNGKTVTVEGTFIGGSSYEFDYTGIAPQCMGDPIDAYLFAEGCDEPIDQKLGYTVKTYAENVRAVYTDPEDYGLLHTLLADLLDYGNESQLYADYRAEFPINEENWIACDRSAFNASALVNAKRSSSSTEYDSLRFTGVQLRLTYVNEILFRIKATDPAGKSVKIFVSTDGGTTFASVPESETAVSDLNKYDALTYEIRTAPITAIGSGDVYKAVLYDGDTEVQYVTYSMDSYFLASHGDALVGPLVKALSRYTKSAQNYAEQAD